MDELNIGLIFCAVCEKMLVDSGYSSSVSSLSCSLCGNEGKFKVGKVYLSASKETNLKELIEIAKKDARISEK